MVEGVPREIIGVLPPWFRFFDYDADVFYPLQHVRAEARFPSGDGRAIARLKKGVTLEAANADVARMMPLLMAGVQSRLPGAAAEVQAGAAPAKDKVVGDLGETLWILMGTMSLLLLIACANVANLMLVRTQSRRSELALRSALGAGRRRHRSRRAGREPRSLGLIGGLAGVALAYVGLPFLLSLGADDLPQIMAVRIDPVVLLVAAATAVGATLVAAGVPLTQLAAAGTPHAEALRGTRSASDGPGGLRTRQMLVVAQVATALVLLIGSGLMIRTFLELRRVDPGFRNAGCRADVPAHDSPDRAARTATRMPPIANGCCNTQRALLDRLSAIGGVESVGFASGNDGLPLDGDGRQVSLIPYVDGVQAADGLARIVGDSERLAGPLRDDADPHRRRPGPDLGRRRHAAAGHAGLREPRSQGVGIAGRGAGTAHQRLPCQSRRGNHRRRSRTSITTGWISRRRR